jgi:hypothetical protein
VRDGSSGICLYIRETVLAQRALRTDDVCFFKNQLLFDCIKPFKELKLLKTISQWSLVNVPNNGTAESSTMKLDWPVPPHHVVTS